MRGAFLGFGLALAFGSGCTHGPTMQEFEPANQAGGIAAVISVVGDTARVSGELLDARDDGLIIATPLELIFVSYDRIRDGRFSSASRLRIGARRTPGPAKRRELSLLSRFPQGLDGEVLRRMLSAYEQDEVVEIR